MELTFLMWNIRNKGTTFIPALKELYEKYRPDFLLLSETDLDDSVIHNLSNNRLKSVMLNDKKSLRLYVNPDHNVMTLSEEERYDGKRRHIKDRLVFFNLEVGSTKIVLVCVHFPSKFNYSSNNQFNIMKRWLSWIEGQEKLFDTEHSIIFGDLNLNPFDSAIYRPGALNCHPTVKHKTTVQPLYYNPMWSTLGDFIYKTNTLKIPGSYFYDIDDDSSDEFHWNSIDGVLIKKSIEPLFLREELEIITTTDNHVFASDNEIFSNKYSDHLPVKFKIKIQ